MFDGLLTSDRFRMPPIVEVPFQWYDDWRMDDLRHIGEPYHFYIDSETGKMISQVNGERIDPIPWNIEYFLYGIDNPSPCMYTPRGKRDPPRPDYHTNYIKRFIQEQLATGLSPTDGEGWRTALTALEPKARADLVPGSSVPERVAFDAEVARSKSDHVAFCRDLLEKCSEKARLFTRVPREDMAWYLFGEPDREAWLRITAEVDPDTLRYVQMRAEDIRIQEAFHATRESEDGEVDEDSAQRRFVRRNTPWRSGY